MTGHPPLAFRSSARVIGPYLGAHSLHLATPAVAAFRDAVEYVHERMPHRQSIVNGSIVSALEGRCGIRQRTERTGNSELFINPLMSMYRHFDLGAVAAHSLYLPTLEGTEHLRRAGAHRSVPEVDQVESAERDNMLMLVA